MYELIEHKVLDADAASITFNNIPQIYEDLLVVVSARHAGTDDELRIYPNGSSSNLAHKLLRGSGSNVTSAAINRFYATTNGYTANTFANGQCYIHNYTASRTKSFSLDSVTENNATTAYQSMQITTWSDTTPISSLVIQPAIGNLSQHTSATLYGVGRKAGIGRQPLASGGYTSFVDGYWVHTFTANGSFKPFVDLDVEYLVVAGGGAGGYDRGSGGGAGGYRSSIAGESSGGGASAESLLSLSGNTNYSVTVGAGGATHTGYTSGNSGSNSTFSTITSLGGGAGRFGSTNTGTDGGSGSGGPSQGGGPHPAGSGTAGQGFDGGNSGVGAGGSGGGGGAGGVGRPGENNNGQAGAGGPGVPSSATGSLVYRAGGGGGGAAMDFSAPRGGGAGGIGGGGAGGNTNGADGAAGTVNTGGGGGGGANQPQGDGGAGGSGIVIVRYRA